MRLTQKVKNDLSNLQHENKYPKSSSNHVGIELEFYCNTTRELLAIDFFRAGLKDKVQVGTDRSVKLFTLGFFGHEIRIIDEECKIKDTVKLVCDIISKYKAKVNKTCGLHVHLDMRNRNKDVCFYNIVKSQDMLFKMVPGNRKFNKYCLTNLINGLLV